MSKALPLEATPDLRGRLALVTGANSGIGFGVARRFARAGAEVVLAVRNTAKGREAAERLGDPAPGGGRVRVEQVDLSSLASVGDLCGRLNTEGRPLHYLVNNAGILAPPQRSLSPDGIELQLATNHLGHFALTGLLLPLLRQAGGRVVSMGSLTARTARLSPEDLRGGTYRPYAAHGTSKLAQLVFALELDRRSRLHGWGIGSNAAHPGAVVTNLQVTGPTLGGHRAGLVARLTTRIYQLPGLGHGVAPASLLPFFAATAGQAEGGAYYGPAGFAELTGPPARAKVPARARDTRTAARLWTASEALTGVAFPDSGD
ncbi:SDR family oxidoreductase [Streptomyces sp. NPDC087420]|uniref:SDR family oxidoreductase n=1 Tax=Streptomyces sp. NPDC087420 TaxID=3365785 RepID=UPI003837DBE2